MRALATLLWCCSSWLAAAPAQGDAQPAPTAQAPQQAPQQEPRHDAQEPSQPAARRAPSPETVAALERLATSIEELGRERAAAQAAAEVDRVKALDERLAEQRRQFVVLAARLSAPLSEMPASGAFDLQQELEQLLRPLLRALKQATAGPRRIADLEARRDTVLARRQQLQRAAETLLATRDALAANSPARAEAEREWQQQLRPQLDDLGSELLVLEANLQQLRDAQQPLLTAVTENVRGFLESSGLNLLLCVVLFVLVYFGMRYVGNRVLRRQRHRGFSMRLAEVLLQVLTLLAAVAATLVVPYARNDWLLLAVGIVFLLGAGWVLVRMAPQFFEQIRLMLNIGAVREGERMVLDGLPYRVDTLRFYSRLVNPELTGGVLRVPIKDLIGQRSRPAGADEPWFPCRQGDVVALTDGVVGKVQLQTPETVVVVERHDAPRSYATTAFLQLHPRNLSAGFEIVITFGLDYRHQSDALRAVPQALHTAVATGLTDDVAPGELREVRIELAAANASSLDFAVEVGFAGSAAPQYHELVRRIQGLLVAACTEHGFGIPFPQLTVHHANGFAGAVRG